MRFRGSVKNHKQRTSEDRSLSCVGKNREIGKLGLAARCGISAVGSRV